LKEAFVKPELQETPLNQSKIKTFLQGIYQSETKHDFQTRLSLKIDGMDYKNDSLIIIVRKEFLIHQSGTWYSYQRPLKPIACLPFYDDTTSFWNILQLNQDGLLVFCQLAVTQMICSDIQMPIRNASNVIIKASRDGKYQALTLDQHVFIIFNKNHIINCQPLKEIGSIIVGLEFTYQNNFVFALSDKGKIFMWTITGEGVMISKINQEPRSSLALFDNTAWPSMTTSLNENTVILSNGFDLVSVQLPYGYQTEISLIDLLLAKASLYTLGQGNLLRGIVNWLGAD
jgi:hypothetical protein